MVLVRLAPSSPLTHSYYLDPLAAIDVAVYLIMAWGMYRCNRVLTAIHFAGSALVPLAAMYETGEYWRALIPAFFFLFFYVPALQGVLQYHRIRKTPPFTRPVRVLFWAMGITFLLGATLGLILLFASSRAPDTATLTEETISSEVIEYLVDRGVIHADEEILYAYFGGVWSYAEDGSLLTDRRAISYANLGSEEGFLVAVPYEDIQSIHIEYGDWPYPTVVMLENAEWEEVTLYFSAETSVDRAACDYLLSRTE